MIRTFVILLLSLTVLYAQERRLYIEHIKVARKKPNGKHWDSWKGKPDLKVTVYFSTHSGWEQVFTSKVYKDIYNLKEPISIESDLTIGSKIKVEIVDKDLKNSDYIAHCKLTVPKAETKDSGGFDSLLAFSYRFSKYKTWEKAAKKTRRFYIEKIVVDKKKPNGKYWDSWKGAPDLKVIVYDVDPDYERKIFTSSVYKNTYEISDEFNIDADIPIHNQIKIEIFDKDMSSNDVIGSHYMDVAVLETHRVVNFDSVSGLVYLFSRHHTIERAYEEQNLIAEQEQKQVEQEKMRKQKERQKYLKTFQGQLEQIQEMIILSRRQLQKSKGHKAAQTLEKAILKLLLLCQEYQYNLQDPTISQLVTQFQNHINDFDDILAHSYQQDEN